MNIDLLLREEVAKAVLALYQTETNQSKIQISDTRKDVAGDKTIMVFPFTAASKKGPEQTGAELGEYLKKQLSFVTGYSVIKGFLNIDIDNSVWVSFLNAALQNPQYGYQPITDQSPVVMVEYSSPNTNKPLHLGHIRNNLLGYSVARILEANGNRVIKANLVNDRGIHICKSMIAWKLFGNGETPQSSGIKGDHLVGKYYVAFDKEYKAQIEAYVAQNKSANQVLAGISDLKAEKKQLEARKDDKANPLNESEKTLLKQLETLWEAAEQQAPIMQQAREMLRLWEAGDAATVELWRTMNSWVYEGFDVTYRRLGVAFDKMQYESETYLLGKSIVLKGLEQGVLFRKDDGSIWCDLTGDGLDQKLLLRPDGTSVYMTQDLGTAAQRFEQHTTMGELIYVVGNEQNYHFQVLKLILSKLGYNWADKIYHLSYGMVELPAGKMKSREGTVVDADDLLDEMVQTSEKISRELGKLDGLSEDEARRTYNIIALAALKYFMLKVEPRKTMLFNPNESIDFNGNTGPFIQYTYARIQSLLRKANEAGIDLASGADNIASISEKEIELIKQTVRLPEVIKEAGARHNPGEIANYVYELVKAFNQFYHDFSILKESDEAVRKFRLCISKQVAVNIRNGMALLGIEVPERM